MKKLSLILFTILLILAIGIFGIIFFVSNDNFQNTTQNLISESSDLENEEDENIQNYEVVAEDMEIPWAIKFLPGGGILVTERTGSLIKLNNNRSKIVIDGATHIGEGGLLGLALHPNFESNNWIYLYLTTERNSGLENRIERYRLDGNQLTERQVILSGIPGSIFHDGGRMEFGPDGFLYITTGDAQNPSLAQKTNSLVGKILRIRDDGSVPADNPFGNEVYAYGFRNPQGLAWDNQKRIWSIDHGRSGDSSGLDELNLVEKGKNYGWPVIQGDQRQEGMETPIINSGPDTTWAPAGMVYKNGSIFFTGLRGSTLYEAKISDGNVIELRKHFENEFGRLRAIELDSNNDMYITTSNTDGRGSARSGDDKLILIKLLP